MEPDFEAAFDLCVEFEGFFSYPYDDLDRSQPKKRYESGPVKGTVTIGYGETDPEIVRRFIDTGGDMSEAEATELLHRRIAEAWAQTKGHFTTDLNPNQGAALTSVAYNAGGAGLARFAPETVKAINERRFTDVARPDPGERFGWSGLLTTSVTRDQSGQISDGLVRRRASEAELFARPSDSSQDINRKAPLMFTCGIPGKGAWLVTGGTRVPVLSGDTLAKLHKMGIPDSGGDMAEMESLPVADGAIDVEIVRKEA
jgi:GH24 family phage-related lysozyme (muramidase)